MKRALALLAVLTACTRASVIGYVELLDGGLAASDDARVAVEPDAGFLSIDNCVPGRTGVPAVTVRSLRGASADAGRWLYPYDETVMPRGVGAPELMWEGAQAKALLVTVEGRGLSYESCKFADSPQAAVIDEADWAMLETHSPLRIRVAMTNDDGAFTLPARNVTVASEALGGSLFYMAYQPILTQNPTGSVVLQLPLGGEPRTALAPVSCGTCHSVSADGTRMIASSNGLGALLAIDANGITQLPTVPAAGELTALSPDARFYVTPARNLTVGPAYMGASFATASTLFETSSGSTIDSGLIEGAMMPSFAMEGDALVFTDYALSAGHGVAMMRFDPDTRRFDGYRSLFTSARYPGWPTLLPGQRGVVFAMGDRTDYARGPTQINVDLHTDAPSDLYGFSLEAGSPTLLHRAMGFASAQDAMAERSELPFPEDELHKSYYPQVAPVEAGGYHWVFFDSVRHYGNRGLRRKIWCAAIDADDPSASHPAFYVRGQAEAGSSIRPQWAR